jgi:hypothetical protein
MCTASSNVARQSGQPRTVRDFGGQNGLCTLDCLVTENAPDGARDGHFAKRTHEFGNGESSSVGKSTGLWFRGSRVQIPSLTLLQSCQTALLRRPLLYND